MLPLELCRDLAGTLDLGVRHGRQREATSARMRTHSTCINERVNPQPSGTKRFLSAMTEVASVIVSDLPATLLMQACSMPPYQGM
jgi:hypothetical protein